MRPDETAALQRIRLLVRRHRGLDLAHYRPSYVRRRIQSRARACRDAGLDAYARRLSGDAEEVARLVAAISTKVTWFFRNPGLYQVLQARILPALLESPRGRLLRAWSAGCATGEEAWSLAAIAATLQPPPPEGRLRVVGTDIDRMAIARARRGEYPLAALRNVPPEIQRRAFRLHRDHGTCRIAPELQPFASFRVENLLDPPAAGAFDLALCRNVLIYFEPALQQRILQNLARGLRPGGYLALGHVERLAGPIRAAFEPIHLTERVYRRL